MKSEGGNHTQYPYDFWEAKISQILGVGKQVSNQTKSFQVLIFVAESWVMCLLPGSNADKHAESI